jgi:hypothetical protein
MSKRGSSARWTPDADSQAMIDLYAARRRDEARPPAAASLESELSHLRTAVYASISLGGPDTLRGLLYDPRMTARVFREWRLSHLALTTYACTFLRCIDLTVDDPQRAAVLREAVEEGLFPRARAGWYLAPRMTGGARYRGRPRFTLWPGDLEKLVNCAGARADREAWRRRDRAIMAVRCWSGLWRRDLPGLTWGRVQFVEGDGIWCAVVHEVQRYGQHLAIPVLVEARPFLLDLLALRDSEGEQDLDYVFRNVGMGRQGDLSVGSAPLGGQTFHRVLKQAAEAAGLPGCDDAALRRAYAALLKARGLPDPVIRDARGVRSLESVEAGFLLHRQAMGQWKMAEHHVIQAPFPGRTRPEPVQQAAFVLE